MTSPSHPNLTLHPFEQANLGKAPFHITGYYRDIGPKCLPDGMTQIGYPGQPMGTCQYCGQGIATCIQIQSSDNKKFIVGCDCAEKCYRDDNRALTTIQRIQATINKQQRDARNKVKQEARQAAYLATLQSQRDRNGGLTDHELAIQQEQAAAAAKAAIHNANNQWIIDRLTHASPSPFVCDMIAKLKTQSFDSLSPRCQGIIAEIYAKTFGRANSKAFNKAIDDFCERTDR